MERRSAVWWCWGPLVVLCVVASSRWILDERWPQTSATLTTEVAGCSVAALIAFGVAAVRKRSMPSVLSALKLMAVGAGLLGMASLGAVLQGVGHQALDRAVAMCFVPVIVAVLSGIWSETDASSLWPGLAGLGGALLIFTLVLPRDVQGFLGLFIPPLAVGAACVLCKRVGREVAVEWSVALLLAGGAGCLLLLDVSHGGAGDGRVNLVAVGLDLLLAVMTVLVVLRLGASRYASIYFVVPLLSIVEGLISFREGVGLKTATGMALLAVAVVGLLRTRGTDDGTSVLHLR